MLIPKVEPRIIQYLNFLEKRAYRIIQDLQFEVFETTETFRTPPQNVQWKPIQSPYLWGKDWTLYWFRTTFQAPQNNGKAIFLSVLPNADSLAFIDEKPAGAFNMYHKKLRISADGKKHSLYIEAYSGHHYGGCGPFEGSSVVITLGKTIPAFPNTFEGGKILERLPEVYALFYDVKALFETGKELNIDSLRKAKILKGLHDTLMEVNLHTSDEILEEQAGKARKKLMPLLSLKNSETTPRIHLVGHAHLDHAWLWHIGETERKTARTFINMTRFMEEYPEFVFIQSQPCQLEIVKNEYPDIFEAIKKAYQKGNWEPNGGMWVEADCNVTSGESLIRQFLIGKKVNKELLGYEADTLWLPDVFGYSAALPQILMKCGIEYFVTSKINWNDTTRFPYETFIWRGLDGTSLKTHFLSTLGPGSGYNGKVSPDEIHSIWNNVQHKEVQSACVKSIGEGDGGGGTMRSDLEMARRLENLEGSPKVSWKKVSEGLKDIFSTAGTLPEWRGELYLELHRGTYTTQSKTKRNNRLLEFALRRAEFLYSVSALDNKTEYPADMLLSFWKKTLTNQFHDIIPGSSITRVYTEAEEESKQMLSALKDITNKAKEKILGEEGGVLIVNDLSWERNDVVLISLPSEIKALQSADGAVYLLQQYRDINGNEKSTCEIKLPAMGWVRFIALSEYFGNSVSAFNYSNDVLETPFYKIKFDPVGRIASFIDKRQNRELVAQNGKFNSFITAEDVPIFWDAWDIDADWKQHIKEETQLISTELISNGAICFRLRRKYAIASSSHLTQDMICYAHDPRIDFETYVSWHETWRLFKVGFDTSIDTTEVRCEVQYGHLWRNTHKNLPQDRAKFEICAHKWISLEEAKSGIALLNDCKYGYDVEGGKMRLSLLRSPIAPDPLADRGEHYFTYSILPFVGHFNSAKVIQSAYELNASVSLFYSSKPVQKGEQFSICSIDNSDIIIECVKAPENGETMSLIIRLYESLGGNSNATLHFSREILSVEETDMLERCIQKLSANTNCVSLTFKPFEIKTIKVSFKV